MNKLNFKEDGYFDAMSEAENEADCAEEMTFGTDSDEGVKDSYALFGIEPNGKSLKEKKSKKQKKEKKDVETEKTVSGDEVEEGAEVETKSAKKKRKKRKLDASTHEDVCNESAVVKAPIGSSFLSKFLSRKREAADVPEPPEIELPNDSFLRMFQDSFKSHSLEEANDVVASDDDGDSLPAYQSTGKKEGLKLSGIHKTDSNASLNASSEADNGEAGKEDFNGSTTAALQLFNLPYRISTEQLQAFGKRYGYKFTTVTMGVDWKTKLPSGSATVQVEFPAAAPGTSKHSALDLTLEEDTPNLYGDPLDDNLTDCIAAMQGEDCGGRPLRVQRFVVKKRQSGSLGGRGDSRYFSGDISCKCHSCGQVGHRQQECTNDAVANPCHLCAGQDHDAGSCPNITCYRCGKFGHHSRDCTFASMAKPVICTNCGSTTHDSRNCRDAGALYNTDVLAPDSKVAGPHVRCMSCNQFGHIMCQSLPPVPAATAGDIYCPNCGLNGHHIDFPLLCTTNASNNASNGESAKKKARSSQQQQNSVPSLCMEPKYDAFMKYPQLLREIDGVTSNERLGYFRDVTRRSSYGDQLLFPPLARQLAPFNNNASAQGGNRGGAPQGRHSFGGGGGGSGGDSGRSVIIKYQDAPAQRSQSVGPRVHQGRSALETTTSALGKRKGFEPELASRYASLHPPQQEDTRPALSSRGRDDGPRDRDRDFNNNNNNRRNSFPANGASRGHSSSNAPAHSRFTSPEPSRQHQGSAHKNRPPAPVLSVPPMAAASAAWNERIESRKRRFNE